MQAQRKCSIVTGIAVLVCTALAPACLEAQVSNSLGQLSNSAISPPLGQGLDLMHGAEPLGKGRFRIRLLNRSQAISLPELGNGSSYTGGYGIGYGFSSGLDISVLVPFLMDSVGGFNKYGSGDPVLGLKWSRPPQLGVNYYTAFQFLLGLPLGYKGEHALDKVGGTRPYSNESMDMGLQFLLDMHFRRTSVILNGGYFRPGNVENLPQLVYGIGLEMGRGNRWGSLNMEYQARVAFTEQSRAAGILKLGARINVYRGIELELNREFGFLDYPADGLFTFGVRLHGNRAGDRRLESRRALYQPPPRAMREYEPSEVLRIAIVDFAGFEEYQAGKRLVERIKTRLEPHDSLEVVDLRRYAEVPHKGFLKPRQALILARKLGVDVVITGAVAEYEVDRFAGLQVPYVIDLPGSRVKLELRYRVIEFFEEDKTEMQAYTGTIDGIGHLRKHPRLLPSDRHDITATASARELQQVQDAAMDNLVGNLLSSLASQFSWVPPGFQL